MRQDEGSPGMPGSRGRKGGRRSYDFVAGDETAADRKLLLRKQENLPGRLDCVQRGLSSKRVNLSCEKGAEGRVSREGKKKTTGEGSTIPEAGASS